jgi:flagellar basal-body rod protein FlgB
LDKVFFEDNNMRLMERFLDLAVQRQSLISSNLANIDTPGYKTLDLSFEQELQSAANNAQDGTGVTHVRHIPLGPDAPRSGSPKEVTGLTIRNDFNNVNIDREMAQLSTNAMKFSMVAQLLSGKFRTLKATIQEGRQ